jgi:hypothetical protein
MHQHLTDTGLISVNTFIYKNYLSGDCLMSLVACLLLNTLIPLIDTRMSFYTTHEKNIHNNAALARVSKISANVQRNQRVENPNIQAGKTSSPLKIRGHSYKLFLPYCRCDVRKHFSNNTIVQPWNELMLTDDNLRSLSCFKTFIRNADLSKYLRVFF